MLDHRGIDSPEMLFTVWYTCDHDIRRAELVACIPHGLNMLNAGIRQRHIMMVDKSRLVVHLWTRHTHTRHRSWKGEDRLRTV